MILKNKVSVITGSNRGIGKCILENFALNRSDIFACVRNIDKDFTNLVNSLIKKYKIKIEIVSLDLSDDNSIKKAVEQIAKNKKVDILVNNAGIIHSSLFSMTPKKVFDEIFNINFFSQMIFTQYISKIMIKKKSGSIINVSSNAAFIPSEGRIAYAASKSAIVTASRVMALEFGRYNIRVNCVAPGLTDTEMMKSSTSEKFINQTLDRIPLKRVGKPEEIANVITFLASDNSSYINGETIRIDGGY